MEAAQNSLCDLATTVQHIFQASEEVSSRLARIETMFAASVGSSASKIKRESKTANSTAQPQLCLAESSNFNSNGGISQFDPNLESELHRSRVYVRTMHRQSMTSLTSTHESVAGFSFLSGISLAQISSISVISLPVFAFELWNSQQYRDTRSIDIDANLTSQVSTYANIGSRFEATDSKTRGWLLKLQLDFWGSVMVCRSKDCAILEEGTSSRRKNNSAQGVIRC